MITHDPERQLWDDVTAELVCMFPLVKFTNTDYRGQTSPLMELLDLYIHIYRYRHEELPAILRRMGVPE